MADRHDDVLQRAIDELRALPPLDESAVSRIVASAARARAAGPAGDDDATRVRRGRFFSIPAVAGIAAAAAVVGFIARGVVPTGAVAPGAPETSVAAAPAAAVVTPALAVADQGALELAPIPTQFVFESKKARSITVVGDFNGWDERADSLVRQPGSQLWTAMIALRPGRHAYAFMVDGERLELDPRAPSTRDPDFDVVASVRIVGQP